EALAESSDWETAANGIKQLQAEWKTIGPVKKTRSEAIWQRFRAACDRFFARYAQRHDVSREERVAAREAIVGERETRGGDAPAPAEGAEAAAGAPDAATVPPPPDLLARMRSIRGRWQQELALRGVDRERAAALDQRFDAGFRKVLSRWPAVFNATDLDPDANRKRMEAIVRRMEELANSLAGPAPAADLSLSPTSRLAAMLKDALAANTIGGKAEDDSRLRAATEEVRQAQASFSRIGLVPDEARRALADRFQRAIRRISERTTVGRSGASGASRR